IPAASSSGRPQLGLVRLGWTPKGDAGEKEVYADVFVSRPSDKIPSHVRLVAKVNVVPAFTAFTTVRREGEKLVFDHDVVAGELRENGFAQRSFYLVSYT